MIGGEVYRTPLCRTLLDSCLYYLVSFISIYQSIVPSLLQDYLTSQAKYIVSVDSPETSRLHLACLSSSVYMPTRTEVAQDLATNEPKRGKKSLPLMSG